MRYKCFRIENFKGIKDTTVSLETLTGASVFAFVGLNESGKTTILEAIHSFSPEKSTSQLVGGTEGTSVSLSGRVPRHLLSNFTGQVSVTATLVATDEDIDRIISEILDRHALRINRQNFPHEIVLKSFQEFENGDFVDDYLEILSDIEVKAASQRKWRPLDDAVEVGKVWDVIFSHAPDIAYFPTLVFDFPDKIFLTERGDTIDLFYRRVFQDILDYDNRGHSIEKDIVRRIRGKGKSAPWISFLPAWSQGDDKAKIQQVMDRASAAVTKLVFGRWNKIFREDAKGKEVVISYEIVEGEKVGPGGSTIKTNDHDVLIKFEIRDGTRRFNVNDRSLGFRWFFAFMLFTQFRVARRNIESLLFMFDEPASNLHSAAQQKLIESFPEIAKGDHTLAYTTHSHYMIEPKWLEQTYIVTNRADTPAPLSVIDAISLDDESLDVKATSYRSFVNQFPGQTSYFQPILDRLEVTPARLDWRKSSIIVEGKSDYYILRYAVNMLGRTEIPIVPGIGAGTLGTLVALHLGWNLNFLFVLDGDLQGKKERERYIEDFGMPADRMVTLDELDPHIHLIEDVLDCEALEAISKSLEIQARPSKGQILRFFQEKLASDKMEDLGDGFRVAMTNLLGELVSRVGAA